MLQAQVPFTVLWSTLVLGSRYTVTEGLGVFIVIAGSSSALLSVINGPSDGSMAAGILLNASLVVAAASFNALAFVLKERVFKLAEENGHAVDIFVVNSGCAIFSLLWSTPVSVLIESLQHPERSPFTTLSAGFACVFGGCPYAWQTYT